MTSTIFQYLPVTQLSLREVFRPDDGVLDLGGQHLGDAIAVVLAAAWPQLGRLQRLHLAGNDITDEGPVEANAAKCKMMIMYMIMMCPDTAMLFPTSSESSQTQFSKLKIIYSITRILLQAE